MKIAYPCLMTLFFCGLLLAETPEPPRDPFWPVGYRPARLDEKPDDAAKQDSEKQVSDEQLEQALARLNVSGIIRRGDRYFATVNGQMVRAGEIVSVTSGGRMFFFRVRSIDMRKVQFEYLD
ncbi:MAG: hypothetical protein ABR497_03120 [Kiritimatiellia bacterium]|nr:hypothetical protein [Lentisphaerota bacterium]